MRRLFLLYLLFVLTGCFSSKVKTRSPNSKNTPTASSSSSSTSSSSSSVSSSSSSSLSSSSSSLSSSSSSSSISTSSSSSTTAIPNTRIGVSAQDQIGSSHRASVERWASFLGKNLSDIGSIQENLWAGSWAELENNAVTYYQREENWKNYNQDFKARFEFNLPMFPQGSSEFASSNEQKWQRALNGEFDKHFRALAQNLITAGYGKAALRLAWEFNGTGGQFPWHIQFGTQVQQAQRAANFIAFWRRIHSTMMSVSGAQFKWVWCPMASENQNYDTTIAWPGDAYVDVVSVDIYDAQGEYYWTDSSLLAQGRDYLLELSAEQRAQRSLYAWNKMALGRDWDINAGALRAVAPSYRGLEWHYNFAKSRNKKFAISEWAIWPRYVKLNNGTIAFSTSGVSGNPYVFGYANSKSDTGGDEFISRMYNWINTHDVAWASYFDVRLTSDINSEMIDHSLSPRNVSGVLASQNPKAAAKFKELFAK